MKNETLRLAVFWVVISIALGVLALTVYRTQPNTEVVELCSTDGGYNFGPCP